MRWICLAWDWFTFLIAALAVTVSTVAVHDPELIAPYIVQAYPDDQPAMTEQEFLTMDNRLFP